MFMERVSDPFSQSPLTPPKSNTANEDTLLKDMPMFISAGNLTSIPFSKEALERAKKMMESPDSQPLMKNLEFSQFRTASNNPVNISAAAISKVQKLFESPSQGSVKEEKDKQTEEVEKKPLRKGFQNMLRAGMIKHNRGELSCNSSIQPKLVNIASNPKITTSIAKRRPQSPQNC